LRSARLARQVVAVSMGGTLSNRMARIRPAGTDSSEAPANLVAHLFAELLPAGGSFVFGNIEPIEDVEFFKDRVTIAGHRQDAQQFAGRPARARDFPSAYRVGAITRPKATQLRHVRRGERSADRITEIHAELL
jgi:hypothetical protein